MYLVDVNSWTINFARTGQENHPLVLFIHGTPGSWKAFSGYLADGELSSKAGLIALDRPGFGDSSPGVLDLSLSSQASTFRTLLNPYLHDNPVILVGHSLGAPIAARMAMDYPDDFAALLLVAPSLDPELENPRWYNRLADHQLVSWLIPETLALANQEVMGLKGELQEMVELWSRVEIPVIVIQGTEDNLVDPANADFAEKMIAKHLKVVRVTGEGHFILWEKPDLIKKELIELLAEISQ